jgi:hypothetical protein
VVKHAYLFVEVAEDLRAEVLSAIRELGMFETIDTVLGPYDIVATFPAPYVGLLTLAISEVERISGVLRTQLCVSAEWYTATTC